MANKSIFEYESIELFDFWWYNCNFDGVYKTGRDSLPEDQELHCSFQANHMLEEHLSCLPLI